jgi:biopolymer transport protein ExbD
MAFNPSQDSDGINDINITPFVDVVLVLLVIFMVTAPVMLKDSLKVKLPKTLTSDLTKKSSSVGLAITREGQVLLNGELVEQEGLEARLKSYAQTAPQTQFLLSADAEAKHGDVVRVIDRLKSNGLDHFALQVEKIKDRP